MKPKPTTIYMSDTMADNLTKRAKKIGMSRTAYIVAVLEQFVQSGETLTVKESK